MSMATTVNTGEPTVVGVRSCRLLFGLPEEELLVADQV